MANLQPLLLAGPTAVGKSEIALLLAERLNGEIVSVDSMQVYRGMDIGTAKPSPEERSRVPHHLIDVADLTESFDAARFAELAHRAVNEIQSRNRLPILCGGTGLYFRAFLDGLGEAPPTDTGLRARLEATPLSDLLRELAERDPTTYNRIDRKNPRRVIRAVEVIRLTGKPFADQRAPWNPPPPDPGPSSLACPPQSFVIRHSSLVTHPSPRLFGLTRSPADLRQRTDARVEEMFRRGLVGETERLLKRGLAENRTAMQALGYRQVIDHLRGERSLPETIERVKIRTRQFAKRQMTWFRRQLQVTWIGLEPHTSAPSAAASFSLGLKRFGLPS